MEAEAGAGALGGAADPWTDPLHAQQVDPTSNSDYPTPHSTGTFHFLDQMRSELYAHRPFTRESMAQWRAFNVDHATIEANCGVLVIAPVTFLRGEFFDFAGPDDREGIISALIEVLDSDGETIIDIVAFPIDQPDRFATAVGQGALLGLSQIENPATYFGGKPIRVHRTPAAWLQSGCDGCCPYFRRPAVACLAAPLD